MKKQIRDQTKLAKGPLTPMSTLDGPLVKRNIDSTSHGYIQSLAIPTSEYGTFVVIGCQATPSTL